MKISVIVPAHNSEATLQCCLEAICNSEHEDRELIVVDDGSTDNTRAIAEQYADRVVSHTKNLGQADARNSGRKKAQGEVLLFVDSDVLVQSSTLAQVAEHFGNFPGTDAVTGLLSKGDVSQGFFSAYKNLYMNFTFRQLPKKVNFLYGSIFAVRRQSMIDCASEYCGVEDTLLGIELARRGKTLVFMEDLEVTHLKDYSFCTLLTNDFKVPFLWARIFFASHGWRMLGWNKTGYAHSPRTQLFGIGVLGAMLVCAVAAFISPALWPFVGVLFLLWMVLASRFLTYLFKERGLMYGLKSVFFTFIDQGVMFAGIVCGSCSAVFGRERLRSAGSQA